MKEIKTNKAPAAIGPYSQAVVIGNMVFTSGQIPVDPTTGEMTLHCLLCADNANFLNPEYLMRGADRELGLTFDDPTSAWYETIRTDIFLQDGVTPFL